MKDQACDLNQTGPVGRKWCRFANAHKIFGPQKFGAQRTSNFGPLFPRLPHSTPHVSGMKRRVEKQKCLCQSTMCPLQGDLLSVTFDPETAEIHVLIVTQHSATITL